ncbi:MAG: hypothetical protein K6G83_03585 [Lachnospiraceae bacterium]|nr:hypothetical protein [Lachnospiraceae bacterium]
MNENLMKNALSEEEMGKVAGGMLFDSSEIAGADPVKHWEVLDDHDGHKIDAYETKADALAHLAGQNRMIVNWTQVQQARGEIDS